MLLRRRRAERRGRPPPVHEHFGVAVFDVLPGLRMGLNTGEDPTDSLGALLTASDTFAPTVPSGIYLLAIMSAPDDFVHSVDITVRVDGTAVVTRTVELAPTVDGDMDVDGRGAEDVPTELVKPAVHSICIRHDEWQAFLTSRTTLAALMLNVATNGEVPESTCISGFAPHTDCPCCGNKSVGVLGVKRDPPLAAEVAWTLDRRPESKRVIYSLVSKLACEAIEADNGVEALSGQAIRAGLSAVCDAEWFANALGVDSADDDDAQARRLDEAAVQWLQEEHRGKVTGKPSSSTNRVFLWNKLKLKWDGQSGPIALRIIVQQRVKARFMDRNNDGIVDSRYPGLYLGRVIALAGNMYRVQYDDGHEGLVPDGAQYIDPSDTPAVTAVIETPDEVVAVSKGGPRKKKARQAKKKAPAAQATSEKVPTEKTAPKRKKKVAPKKAAAPTRGSVARPRWGSVRPEPAGAGADRSQEAGEQAPGTRRSSRRPTWR